MGYQIRPLAAAMAAALSSTAVWQTAIAQGAPVLGDVVVTADRPQPLPDASAVDDRRLAPMRAGTSDSASLLRDVPGVSL